MTWVIMEPWVAGAAGGFVLGIGRMVISLKHLVTEGHDIQRFLLAQSIPIVLFVIMGTLVSGFTQGVASSFLTGVTVLGFVLALAGTSEHEEGGLNRA